MGAAGRAIGPDGKPLKQDPKGGVKKGGAQQANQRIKPPAKPNTNNRFGSNPGHSQRFEQPMNGSPGPRGLGPRPLMSTPGMAMGGPVGPMGGRGHPGHMGGREGPAMGGGPMGPRGGMGPRPGLGHVMGGHHLAGLYSHPHLHPATVPDPTGSYGGFFGAPKMNDSGNGSAPPALIPPRKEHPAPSLQAVKPVPAPASLVPTQAKASDTQAPSGSQLGEVPGFGHNTSLHELFGKMVWRKMEGVRDQQVVDELQNKIMNLIHDALAAQNADSQQLNRGAFGQGGGIPPPRRF